MDPPESTIPPDCRDDLIGYLQIFWQLNTCRTYSGMGGTPCPIPWTAIDQYAQRTGAIKDEILYDDLIFFITKMDEVYLTHASEKSEAAAKSKSPPKSGFPGKSEW